MKLRSLDLGKRCLRKWWKKEKKKEKKKGVENGKEEWVLEEEKKGKEEGGLCWPPFQSEVLGLSTSSYGLC